MVLDPLLFHPSSLAPHTWAHTQILHRDYENKQIALPKAYKSTVTIIKTVELRFKNQQLHVVDTSQYCHYHWVLCEWVEHFIWRFIFLCQNKNKPCNFSLPYFLNVWEWFQLYMPLCPYAFLALLNLETKPN